jgi:hypothetical protein
VRGGGEVAHVLLTMSFAGAMTALTGLSSERKLAGLAILSGWTPIRNTLKQARPLASLKAPVAHARRRC